MRQIIPYCTCGHSIKDHMLFEDPGMEGVARADCQRCDDHAHFVYDHQLSVDEDEAAYQRAMEWRMNK